MSGNGSAAGKPQSGSVARAFILDLMELAKLRITIMVLITTAVGYILGAGPFREWPFLAGVLAATFLLAAGVNALNQYLERTTDGLMRRTSNRPLPAGRMRPRTALIFGIATSLAGVLWLGLGVNLTAGMVGAAVIVTYVMWYTPLKRVSGLNTLVGAIPGALPPVLGWVAGAGSLGREAAALFLILFVWQLPHFLAIAYLCREDYASAGMRMLTVIDPSGGAARRQLLIYTVTLIPVSMYPSMIGLTGEIYFYGALVLGLVFLTAVVRMALALSDRRARLVLKGSVLYLPALYVLMIYDARVF